MSSSLTSLQELADSLHNCQRCPLAKLGRRQVVFGVGNPHASVMFVGEAPGFHEDQKGEPFVGAAGQLLNDLLESAGLSRADIYIANVIKCRPPNNRDPSPEEKKAFWPYLLKQLQIIEPKIVVTLGRHSMEYFLPEARISDTHGQPKQIKLGGHKLVIVPQYHPAAALYNGSLRQTLIDDFLRMPDIIRGV